MLKDFNQVSKKTKLQESSQLLPRIMKFSPAKTSRVSVFWKENLVLSAESCFTCLQSDHSTKDCISGSSCRNYTKRHKSIHVLAEAGSAHLIGSAMTCHSGRPFTLRLMPSKQRCPQPNTSSEHNMCRPQLNGASQPSFVTKHCSGVGTKIIQPTNHKRQHE